MLKQLFIFIASAFLLVVMFSACSNSECVEGAENVSDSYNNSIDSGESFPSSSKIVDYLPLDDTEYPYAGIPRIVIETENNRAIRDREIEIPAKLQIWGKKAPESEVMNLTIRGRGNTTWYGPKKPYAIKFEKKQAFLGMHKAKKWVMLANYRDRTLIRNALAFEIARQTSQEWVPQGKFVDVFLNKKFIGNYYICEEIEVKKNRVDLDSNAFLLEFDAKYDEEYKFKSSYKNLPINIKYPKEVSEKKLEYIRNYIDTIECVLYGACGGTDIRDYIDLRSFASYWIVQEITQNYEARNPKSVYAYKDYLMKFGPVWDFDWQTFTSKKKGLGIKDALWLDSLKKNNVFRDVVKEEWNCHYEMFLNLIDFIDSVANYTKMSNELNYSRWGLDIASDLAGDEDKDFSTAIDMMKYNYIHRLKELNDIFNNQL